MTKDKSYLAKLGCLNCDYICDTTVNKGISIAQFLMDEKPLCKQCGCELLTKLAEYKAEKKIMKDMILHHRIQSMENDIGKSNENTAHYK